MTDNPMLERVDCPNGDIIITLKNFDMTTVNSEYQPETLLFSAIFTQLRGNLLLEIISVLEKEISERIRKRYDR